MFKKALIDVFVFIIRLYQACISPFLVAPCCRFHPSCSQYAIDAIKMHGPAKGSWLGFKRILRCNPLHPGGYDPIK